MTGTGTAVGATVGAVGASEGAAVVGVAVGDEEGEDVGVIVGAAVLQTKLVQMLLSQSLCARHFFPGAHRVQLPPQLRSVSSPSTTALKQWTL